MTYAEKLKNPKWQKRRLQIYQRDDFSCQECFSKEETLHLHHLDYLPNTEPWDYPDEYFLTLCASCHEKITKQNKEYERIILNNIRIKCPYSFQINQAAYSLTEYQYLYKVFLMMEILPEEIFINALLKAEEEYLKTKKTVLPIF